MALLDDVIDAGGGMALWNRLSRFTLHLSIGGTLLTGAHQDDYFKDVIGEGSLQNESIRFTGIAGGQKFGSFHPDLVTIETLDGKLLRTWQKPDLVFSNAGKDALTDELRLIVFCGVAVWNYLTTPFVLARPDVEVEELPAWRENNGTWRRLRARFPSHLITHAPEQIFYFDEYALQRRNDHDLLSMKAAHYSWAHQPFNGIMIPTLRRSQILERDGTVAAKPVLIDVEIFDASFE